MAKQQYWLVGGEADTHALVTGAAERDNYLRSGDWKTADEPADGDWVYIWHESVTVPGRVPVTALRDLWSHRGWVAGPPPGADNPVPPEPAAEPPAEAKNQPADGGKSTEE
jgi:hypothetical protein